MSRRLTTADFISKARQVHGDRYDYSKTNYVNNSIKITINCRDHGAFTQTPNNHLGNHGCPDCAGKKQLTTETFIEKAKAAHGEKYDYSKVEYVSAHERVTIICPDHGPFQQTANAHRRGQGCPDCGRLVTESARRLTTEEFIPKAKAVHGDRYDYSQVEYLGRHKKVRIICSDHGQFVQTPGSHLSGRGCPKCGKLTSSHTRRKATDEFIADAKAVHGDSYDYSLTEYRLAHSEITIICHDHGQFKQRAYSHLNGKGCPECGGSEKLTTEVFIDRARAVHGDRYDYSRVEYLNSNTKITIVCPDHGPFPQIPESHINQKSGCPACAEYGFNPSEPARLYYVAVTTDNGDTRYKIGITKNSVKERFNGADLARIRVVKTWKYAIGRAAAERESEILNQYAGDRYYGPDILTGPGNRELFTHDVLGLDR
jgi:ribosomal protein L36